MQIGILGGSFNPPHLGHAIVVRQVLDFTEIEKIWLLPAFKHTFNKNLAPAKDRLQMTQLLTEPDVSVSSLEIDYNLDGSTLKLLPLLRSLYPKDTFTFLIGSDQLPTFNKWVKWEELLRLQQFLVIPRSGYPSEPLYRGMRVLNHPLLATTNISSTLVRERVKLNLPIGHFVPEKVEEYIKKHGLYK